MKDQKQTLLYVGGFLVVAIIATILVSGDRRPPIAFDRVMTQKTSMGLQADDGVATFAMRAPAVDMAVMEESMARPVGANMIMPSPEPGFGAGEIDLEIDRQVIRSGYMSLLVDNVSQTITSISSAVESLEGFVEHSNINRNTISPQGSIRVRVPVERFDEAFTKLKEYGEVQSEQTDGQDVTEEYVDLQAQLNNLQATEAQFLTIMERAVEIEDVLAVQRELSNVRSQIERIEGRIKFLDSRTNYSSITVNLVTDPEDLPVIDDTDKWKPLAVAKDALRGLVVFAQDVVNVLIWLVVYIPLWIVIGLLFWGVKKVMSKRSR